MYRRLRGWVRRQIDRATRVNEMAERLARIEAIAENQMLQLGRFAAKEQIGLSPKRLSDREFKVFSQWGEDGIIQGLIGCVPMSRPIFVEFGVESYHEANTRFLLMNNNWSGLVMDSNPHHIENIRRSELYWRYNLTAERAFVTCENINQLISDAGISGEIGLLSVDVDGNDYWVWQAIDVVSPDIVVVEYNARFGPTACVTVPYKADFERAKEHYSMIYYGASLAALCKLGAAKGFAFIGCNSAGNNAFFVRHDKLPPNLPALTAEQGFVAGKFREARDEMGRLAFLGPDAEKAILEKLPVETV